MEPWLNADEAAAHLRTSTDVLLALTQRGVVPAFRATGAWRFLRTELDQFIVGSGLYRDRSIAPCTMRSRVDRWVPGEDPSQWRCPTALAARPDQLPDWAKQGRFHFARFDGGIRHAEKAIASGWHKLGMTTEITAFARECYRGHLPQMIAALRRAGINWVWITWNVGFSLEYEQAQFEEARDARAMLHAAGIHVAAYMSCNNMFWEEMERSVPGAAAWSLCEGGIDLTYEHRPQRRLANLRHPAWFELAKRRMTLAHEAGVDAFFYDNCEAPAEDLLVFLPQLRAFLRQELRSSAPLMLNLHLYHRPHHFMLADLVDVIYNEWGFSFSGVKANGQWDVVSIRNPLRYTGGSLPGKPMFYELPRSVTTGIRPRTHCLHIFEAAAFGASAAWFVEGYSSIAYAQGIPEAVDQWEAVGRAHAFLDARSHLYCDTDSAASIGVLVLGPNWAAAVLDEWTRSSLLYDIIDVRAMERVDLSRYRVLVVIGFAGPTQAMLETLPSFRSAGGRVVVLSDAMAAFDGAADECWPLHATESECPDLDGARQHAEASQSRRIGQHLSRLAGPPRVQVEAEFVLANVRQRRDDSLIIVHLLNYHNLPARPVKVRIELPEPQKAVPHVKADTPDGGALDIQALHAEGGVVSFVLDRLDQYAVVSIGSPAKADATC
ncbi:MAG: helix-turn-helix domain-containing protein [Phycisphaeraceae bacterium]